MREIQDIVKIIETYSKKEYGSVNKMLIKNNLSKSVIDNMKKSKPSIPNIEVISKIADDLNISLDWLLNNKDCSAQLQNDSTLNEVINLFSQLDERSKDEVIGFIKAKLL